MTSLQSPVERTAPATASGTATSGIEGDDLIGAHFARLAGSMGVNAISLMTVDGSGSWLTAVASHGLEDEVRQGFRLPVGEGFRGQIAATGLPARLESVDASTVRSHLLVRRGIRSLLGVPVRSPVRLLGVLLVGSLERRRFADAEVDELERAAAALADHLMATRRREEDWASRVLQRSLLPSRLPAIDGLEFAARFVPGGHASLGGDWYDVFRLPDERVGLVMGDVAGSGLSAAVVMGRLRSVLRSYAFIGDDPAETLSRIDAKFTYFEPGELATILFAVVAPDRGAMTIASAGHPSPVLVGGDRAAEFVPVPVGTPIGARLGTPRRSIRLDLPPGSTLVTYTDGLFERRDQPLDASLELLRTAVTPGPLEPAVNRLMQIMIGSSALEDDTALLAIRRPERA